MSKQEPPIELGLLLMSILLGTYGALLIMWLVVFIFGRERNE